MKIIIKSFYEKLNKKLYFDKLFIKIDFFKYLDTSFFLLIQVIITFCNYKCIM